MRLRLKPLEDQVVVITGASSGIGLGALKEGSVVCPWHGFEFALDDGRVLNGPATHDQPCLAERERDGRIEVTGAPHPADVAQQ